MVDPLVGTAVAHYEVLAKLGGGGMGVVYTARDTRLGRVVALKFLPPQWSHDDSAKQRFLREAQAASATLHRNICTIHDIQTAGDGQLFIVMAYYEGPTLKQKLEAGPLPIEEAVEIAAQVAEGLAKAHGEGVVHRDIKPGNLMVIEDDVKILDFGLAKFANSLQLTLEGSTLGTVAYMSPEQSRGEEADARSDIWAVGVVLYEMLTGTLPFRGAYQEAISHAIRNDPFPAVRGARGDVPAELCRIIGRALAKDPAERLQSARELARELRQLQGRTIPLDLLPTTINAPPLQIATPPRWWRTRATLSAVGLLAMAAVAGSVWLFSPIARMPVVIAPVVNQTGYAELDAYRAALTEELIAEFGDSPLVRVLPYDRELQILRRFHTGLVDISSREAIQALTTNSGAGVVVVPTLLYDNGTWRARVEFRGAATATNAAVEDTAPVVSSLMKETVYGLMPQLTAVANAHFVATAPRRVPIANEVRRIIGRAAPAPSLRMRSLDTAAAFERGLDAYEQMEYGSALRELTEASKEDPRNPFLLGWRSLVSHIMRRDDDAAESGEQGVRLLTAQTPEADRLFVEAVAAESRRDEGAAAGRYAALVDRHRDDPALVMQRAAFEDRDNRTADAVASYLGALALDARQPRPNVELCRMYNRLNEAAKAREYAQKGLTAYQALGARSGEGQALLCFADALRVGSDSDREQANRYAQDAATIFSTLAAPYNLSRAYNYLAMISGMQDRRAEAAAFGEQALVSARQAGNTVLQPLVLMNLGVTHLALGQRARAVDYFLQSSKLYEALGDQTRAAQIQANRANVLVDYGPSPDEGLRDVQNALAVFRKVGDKNFEVKCLQIMAAYYRNTGRHADAERELNRALALARERELKDDIASLTVDLARLHIDRNEYATAIDLLVQGLGDGSGPKAAQARVYLAQSYARLGDTAAANQSARAALQDATRLGDREDEPTLHAVMGELAYGSGNMQDARAQFARSSALWSDTTPDGASVEARAYLGLLDALGGHPDSGRKTILASLEQAQKMARYSLEGRCRVFLARLDVSARRFDDAVNVLREVAADGERTLGPELQAQVHYWRARALAGRGDGAAAARDDSTSRAQLQQLRASIPERFRAGFDMRRDLQLSESTERVRNRPETR
jgi:tetratricopeptide (TPR) repeat protein